MLNHPITYVILRSYFSFLDRVGMKSDILVWK